MSATRSRPTRTTEWLGKGIYTLADAARFASMPAQSARRWILGYDFGSGDQTRRSSPPVFERELPDVDGEIALTFLDLVELLFVRRFRDRGVPLQTIRRAAAVAAEMFGEEKHPFAVRRFETDGQTVLARIEAEDREHLLDLARRQHVFREVFDPLIHKLDYELDRAARWWPLGKEVPVVVDPNIAFGQPTIAGVGVPTDTLAATARAWGDIERVARWYDVDPEAVRAALRYEDQQDAA